MDLAGPNLGCPRVPGAVAVGEKDDELPVARNGGVMLASFEVGQPGDLRAFQRTPPEVLRVLQLPRCSAPDEQQTHTGRGPPCESARTASRRRAIARTLGGRPGRRNTGTRRLFKFEARVADVAQTALRIFLETALEQSSDADGRLRWQRAPVGLAFEDADDGIGDGLAAKRRPGCQHLVQHAAKRPDVGPLVDRLPARLLGTHIGGGARNHAFSCVLNGDRRLRGRVVFRSFSRKHLRQPEVEHLHRAVRRDLDVGRFQIAVDDALLVCRLERLGDLARDRECLRNRQRTRR